MVESRCGILCKECEFQEKAGCKGCIHIDKPFWGTCDVKVCCDSNGLEHCGQCTDFPCEVAKNYAYDECQGDDGKRLEQCKKWLCSRGAAKPVQ